MDGNRHLKQQVRTDGQTHRSAGVLTYICTDALTYIRTDVSAYDSTPVGNRTKTSVKMRVCKKVRLRIYAEAIDDQAGKHTATVINQQ